MTDINRKLELAWAAGFFDGEGSTMVDSRPNHQCRLRCQVWQKDARPLHRFHRAIGIGNIYGPYVSQRDKSVWVVQSARAEEAILMMWPFLSEPKREQAQRSLDIWRARPDRRKTWREYGRTSLKAS